MHTPSQSSKKRLKFALIVSVIIVIALIFRLVHLQIINSNELRKGALEQWTKSIDIKPKRGVIYDRNGKKLAVSVNAFTVWATPAEIENPKETAKTLSQILSMEEEEVYEKITKKERVEKLKQWISRDEANELRDQNLKGISVVDDNKRYYPNGNFASYVLGFTDIDNNGLDGVEKTYNEFLTGVPGKWMKMTDASNRQLPYDGERVHDPKDGTSIVLTIDETLQHFAEKAAQQALVENQAKNISIILMEPDTGDILAMAAKPDFDPNNPREPLDPIQKEEWKNLPTEELTDKWYDLWRNFAINDIYEPGSTFKVITAAAALEEGTTSLDSHYYCRGTVKVQGRTLKCANWYNPHGNQDLREAMNNSCNVAFVNIGRELGKDNLYKYIKGFGFGEKTNIDLLGEQAGIIPSSVDNIKEISLATMSYGHGIAVTPIQLLSAVSTIANGGNLMKPRLVKETINDQGEIEKKIEPELVRKVLSKETSNTMLSMMETVVSDGSGSRAKVPGYKIGGKTGTAQKIIDGIYAQGKYIGSFLAVAPADEPQIAMLVIVDEPSGQFYGGSTAAPVAQNILEEIFNYLEISPEIDEDTEEDIINIVQVPDVREKTIGEAGKVLTDLGLQYTTEYIEITEETKIMDQFPQPGVEVQEGSIIDLYVDLQAVDKISMPFLMGKEKAEVIKILDEMNLQYNLDGQGRAKTQEPSPGQEIKLDTKIMVEFE